MLSVARSGLYVLYFSKCDYRSNAAFRCACRVLVDFSWSPSHAWTVEKCDSLHLVELKHEFIRITVSVIEML